MKKISFNDYIPEELSDTESCRLITTEQYQEYLKLKEEHKPLSWEELKEEAKKMGALVREEQILYANLEFWKDGEVWFFDDLGRHTTLAVDRKPDQMLAIMKVVQ